MRVLEFGRDDDARRYILCYQALCYAEGELERSEVRVHGSLLTKLETIGELANPDRRAGDLPLYRCPAGGSVHVSEHEYAILKRFLVAFLPKLVRALSRQYEAALEWCDNVAEMKEPAAPKRFDTNGVVNGVAEIPASASI
jgi:hypothetical protein